MNDLLFVYGTLVPGNGLLDQIGIKYTIIGKGCIRGKMLTGTAYPAVVPCPPDQPESVTGLICSIENPDVAWPLLDEYEDYLPGQPKESLYVRKTTIVTFDDGQQEACWIYWYNLKPT